MDKNKFGEKFDAIVAFKKENGHCDIPEESTLGKWLGGIRKATVNPGNEFWVTPEQIQRMKDLGVRLP
jgi:hypothetical protein